MEGGGEGVDPIIKDLHNAAIAVTVLNRRLLETANSSLRPRPSIQFSVETNTDPPRCSYNDRSTFIPKASPKSLFGGYTDDDHYTSTYRIAHCYASPTSSLPTSSEFPPQSPRPSRERGNFVVGGVGVNNNFYTSPCESTSLPWSERESASFVHEPQRFMEAFVQSLRKYPTERSERESSEIVQKLLDYTQNKYLNQNLKRKSRELSPTESLSPYASMKCVNKRKRKSRDFGSNTCKNLRIKVPHMKGRCFVANSNYSYKLYKSQFNDTYDYLDSPCRSKSKCPSQSSCGSRKPSTCRPKRVCMATPPCVDDHRGYFYEVKKYIRDTIRQMYDEKPAICPGMKNRHYRHRRKHHRVSDIELEIPCPPNPSQAVLSPEPAGPCPATFHKACDTPGPSFLSQVDLPPVQAGTCPTAFRPCIQPTGSRREISCPFCYKPLPCFCQKYLRNTEAQAAVKEVIHNWLKELPVTSNDTPCKQTYRENLINLLAKDINNLQNNPDFERKARDAIEKCLECLPIWYPPNPSDQEVFKNKIIDDLLNGVKSYLGPDPMADIVRNKLSSLHYDRGVDIEQVVDKFKTDVTPLLKDRDQSKAKITELLSDLPIANKNEALNSIVESLCTELRKIDEDISDAKLEQIVSEWLENSTELPSRVEQKKINDLIKQLNNTLKKHLNDQAEREQLNNDITEWIDLLLKSRNEILDTVTKQNLVTKLIDKIKVPMIPTDNTTARMVPTDNTTARMVPRDNTTPPMVFTDKITDPMVSSDKITVPMVSTDKLKETTKARKRWSDEAVLQSNNNEILDLLKDVPGLDPEKAYDVSQKIANVLTKRSDELSTNPLDVQHEVKGILKRDTDMSEPYIREVASEIINRKISSANKRSLFQPNRAISTKDLENQVCSQVSATLDKYHIDRNKSLENSLVDSCLDEIIHGPNDNTRDDIVTASKNAQVPEYLAHEIADELIDKTEILKDMRRSSITLNRTELDIGSSTPKRATKSYSKNRSFTMSPEHKDNIDDSDFYSPSAIYENEKQYTKEVEKIISSWIDDLPISSKDKSYLIPSIRNLTNDIIDRQKYLQINPNESHSSTEELDNLKYQVFRWVNKIPEMEGKINPVIDQTEDLKHKLSQVLVPVLTQPVKGTGKQGSWSFTDHSGSTVPTTHSVDNAVENLVKSLPLQKGAEKIPQTNKDNLARKLSAIIEQDQGINENTREDIEQEIKKFITQSPVDKRAVNPKDITEKFIDDIKKSSKQVSASVSYKSPRQSMESAVSTYTTGTNTSLKHPSKKKLIEYIEEWVNNLPLKEDTPEEQDKIKRKIANRLIQKVTELNINPETFEDDFRFQQLLDDELDNLASEYPELKKHQPQLKKDLRDKVKPSEVLTQPSKGANKRGSWDSTGHTSFGSQTRNEPNAFLQQTNRDTYQPDSASFRSTKFRPHRVESAVKKMVKSLPLQRRAQNIPQPNIENLTRTLSDIINQDKDINDNTKENIEQEIEKFINLVPVDKHAVNTKDVTQKFINDIERELTNVSALSPQTSMDFATSTCSTGVNTSLNLPPLKRPVNELFQSIKEWADNLPMKGDTLEEQEKINKRKKEIANRLTQKIGELNMNPETSKDDFMFEQLFEDEVDNTISEIPQLKKNKSQLKKSLMDKVKDARRKTNEEMAGKEYKQKLRASLSKTLPPDTNEDENDLFEVLKDDVADGFLNLHYADETGSTAAIHRKEIRGEIDKFIDNYLSNHPNAPIDTETLNRRLYEALKSVPPPKEGNEALKNEVELIRTKGICDDWAKKNHLFKDQTAAEKLFKNKALAVLATKIKEIEDMKDQLADFDYEEALKEKINKWLTNTAKIDRDDIGKITDELISLLKDTESSRHVEATARHSIGPEFYLSSSSLADGLRSKSKTLRDRDTRPPSTLSVEDRLYMEKVRQRNQEGYSSFDGVSSNGQAGQLSKQAIGRQAGLTPHVIVKEYHWDSESCKFWEIPKCSIPGTVPPCIEKLQNFEKSPTYQETLPCPQMSDYSDNAPISQRPLYQVPPPCARRPVICPGSPCTKKDSKSSQYERPDPFGLYPRRPVISPKLLCDISLPERPPCAAYSGMPPCTATACKQSQTCPWASASCQKYDPGSSSVKKPNPCWNKALDYDGNDNEFVKDSKEERYNCKCEERKIDKRCTIKSKEETIKKCSKCCGVQCPYPSFCYFNR